MPRRALLHVALAFFLAFAQASAAVHALSHLADADGTPSQTGKQLPHSQLCEQCLASVPLGGAMPAAPLVIAVHGVAPLAAAPAPVNVLRRFVPAYSSRAPPATLA